jgi:hypothetical protein
VDERRLEARERLVPGLGRDLAGAFDCLEDDRIAWLNPDARRVGVVPERMRLGVVEVMDAHP